MNTTIAEIEQEIRGLQRCLERCPEHQVQARKEHIEFLQGRRDRLSAQLATQDNFRRAA